MEFGKYFVTFVDVGGGDSLNNVGEIKIVRARLYEDG